MVQPPLQADVRQLAEANDRDLVVVVMEPSCYGKHQEDLEQRPKSGDNAEESRCHFRLRARSRTHEAQSVRLRVCGHRGLNHWVEEESPERPTSKASLQTTSLHREAGLGNDTCDDDVGARACGERLLGDRQPLCNNKPPKDKP